MRKRQVKKYGGTWVIQLTPADVIDFELSEGDIIDIDSLNVLSKKKKK